ncbi:SCP2 sterol-binding domain-containing protein [Natrinema zhouii]|uniref:SCP2 sterol-binding domain-containing protein n=1 Tax=Natrinema zhouii TaxID=1710539 RepID=A0A7D6GR84_9EURY|nr:SCP2 sterol-binding domain-containing protein [Natrinema zhouii]QLK27301.1 SCP2 sterol-binding domain-containing protein [Natrinema zhouii]
MSTQQLQPIEQYFPTEPWLEAYRDAINESNEYAEHSAGWGVDFDGSFIFQIEGVPLESNTIADLPPEIVDAAEDELTGLSESELESVLEEAPAEVRERIESRSGPLEERVTEEVLETTMAEIPDHTWPELRAEFPDLLAELITQLEENIADDGTVYAYLDLYDGECREVDTITDLDEREYGFRLVGDFEQWKTLVRGEGGVIDMLMSGDFEIDGDMQKILQYSDAAVDLAETAADVDSRFIF